MNLNYEKDITIDESALDVEWLGQAELARKYAKHLAYLKKIVKQKEEQKKTKRSELIIQVNENPEKCINKAKPNAADIEAYYRTQDDYKVIVNELLEAQEELEYTELVFNEIAWTRKKSLENLVKLHGQQYFAGPKVPRDLSQEWVNKQRQKQSDAKVAKAMRRK